MPKHSQGESRACQALLAYLGRNPDHGTADLLYELRMMWDWDDDAFRELVELAKSCLVELEGSDQIPRYVAGFFASYIPRIENILGDPRFLAHNRDGRTEQETVEYFDNRRLLLRNLCTWLNSPRCPYPPEHFTLPEWSRAP